KGPSGTGKSGSSSALSACQSRRPPARMARYVPAGDQARSLTSLSSLTVVTTRPVAGAQSTTTDPHVLQASVLPSGDQSRAVAPFWPTSTFHNRLVFKSHSRMTPSGEPVASVLLSGLMPRALGKGTNPGGCGTLGTIVQRRTPSIGAEFGTS